MLSTYPLNVFNHGATCKVMPPWKGAILCSSAIILLEVHALGCENSNEWTSFLNWQERGECVSLCMTVRVHACMSVCIHDYVCVCACMHVCVCAYMCVCVFKFVCVCMHVCVCK